MQKWVDPLERLIRDHRYVSEYVEGLEKISGFLHSPAKWKGDEFDGFLRKYFYAHFAYEEENVFPVLMKNIDDPVLKRTVQELYKEHEDMLGKVSRLRERLKKGHLDKDVYDLAKEALTQFLEHASKEDDELIPVIEKNSRLFRKM